MEVGSAGLGGCAPNLKFPSRVRLPNGILTVIDIAHVHLGAEPPWFSPSSSAPRTTPSSRAGASAEWVAVCGAARRLPPAGGTTQIYLRSPSARPAIR